MGNEGSSHSRRDDCCIVWSALQNPFTSLLAIRTQVLQHLIYSCTVWLASHRQWVPPPKLRLLSTPEQTAVLNCGALVAWIKDRWWILMMYHCRKPLCIYDGTNKKELIHQMVWKNTLLHYIGMGTHRVWLQVISGKNSGVPDSTVVRQQHHAFVCFTPLWNSIMV